MTSEGPAAFVKMAHTSPSGAPGRRLAGTVGVKRRHIMGNHAVEAGWQRFLDRLKQLWGKLGQGDKPSPAAG